MKTINIIQTVMTILLFTFQFNLLHAQPPTNLRGQVVSFNAYYNINQPLVNASATLYYLNRMNNRWVAIAQTVTDQNGMYYFWNINPGPYTIQINSQQNYDINVGVIDKRYYQFLDLPRFIY